MTTKTIAVCYMFASLSDPNKFYDTLLYTDGTTSCPCKGWTRRVAPDGSRSCKHTRMIDSGLGEQCAVRWIRYQTAAPGPRKINPPVTLIPKTKPKKKKPATVEQPVSRRFEF